MGQRSINHSWRLWHSAVCDVYLGQEGERQNKYSWLSGIFFRWLKCSNSRAVCVPVSESALPNSQESIHRWHFSNCHMGGQVTASSTNANYKLYTGQEAKIMAWLILCTIACEKSYTWQIETPTQVHYGPQSNCTSSHCWRVYTRSWKFNTHLAGQISFLVLCRASRSLLQRRWLAWTGNTAPWPT